MQDSDMNEVGEALSVERVDSKTPDVKGIIADMVARGDMGAEDAAKFERMFSGGGMQRVGKHNIARGLRAKARIAKRKKKR